MCAQLGIKIVRKGPNSNDNKLGYISLFMRYYAVRSQHANVQYGLMKHVIDFSVGTRKGKNCVPRLLNVMFSNQFASRHHEMPKTLTRTELDKGAVGPKSTFWMDLMRECQTDRLVSM